MGLGLGGYVDRSADAVLNGVTYLQFLAPGLLASSLMQTGSFEASFPILGGLQWNKIFHAMVVDAVAGPRRRAGQPRLDRVPADARRGDLRGRDRRFRGEPLAADRPGHSRRGAHGRRVRRPDHGVHGDPADARLVRGPVPVRDHAAVPVQRHVLPDREPAVVPPARSPGFRRCGTAWTCAAR